MAFWGDYHTHTVFSHGKGTPEENILAAISHGFKEIGITDHGFKHIMYCVRRMDWPFIMRDVNTLKKKYPQINIYLGLETNFQSLRGDVDILDSDMKDMDILICGYHKLVFPTRFSDFFSFYLPIAVSGVVGKTSVARRNKNTDAFIKALERYKIDIMSHPKYGVDVDVVEIAKACKHFGTYMELNGKKISMSKEEIEGIMHEGVELICDSDAHSVDRVGDMSVPLALIEKYGIPYDVIANWERLPNFRSRQPK